MALLFQRLLQRQAGAADALVQHLTPAFALSGRCVADIVSLQNFTPAAAANGVRQNQTVASQDPLDPAKLRNFAVIGL